MQGNGPVKERNSKRVQGRNEKQQEEVTSTEPHRKRGSYLNQRTPGIPTGDMFKMGNTLAVWAYSATCSVADLISSGRKQASNIKY